MSDPAVAAPPSPDTAPPEQFDRPGREAAGARQGAAAARVLRAVGLLKEYTAKLHAWSQDFETAFNAYLASSSKTAPLFQARLGGLVDSWARFRPPAHEFASEVSGMIEHWKLDTLDRAELRFLLAEFEGALLSYERFVTDWKKAWPSAYTSLEYVSERAKGRR